MKSRNKNSAKPFIAISLFVFAVLASIILLYVGLKLECEKLTKEKVLAEEKLNAQKNWKVSLTAQEQALSAEERIVRIAEQELNMVKGTQSPVILTVSKDKIEHISEELEKKYEKF